MLHFINFIYCFCGFRSVFSEGSMKQEANNDDGYETSVDHLDLRSHNQGEQGKMNQNMMEQHMQQNSSQVVMGLLCQTEGKW